MLVTYADREAVLYRDKLQGKYEAEKLTIPAGATNVAAADLNNDGWIDVVYTASDRHTHRLEQERSIPERARRITPVRSGFALADLENRGTLDLVSGPTVFRNDRKGGFTKRADALPVDCPSWTAGTSTTMDAWTSPAARSSS